MYIMTLVANKKMVETDLTYFMPYDNKGYIFYN